MNIRNSIWAILFVTAIAYIIRYALLDNDEDLISSNVFVAASLLSLLGNNTKN